MSTAILLRIGLAAEGVAVMILAFWLHSTRKLTVNLAVVWELAGITMLIVAGVQFLSGWCRLVSKGTAVGILVAGSIGMWIGFELSILISQLSMKNQELAMQVSLINQENERMLDELSELTGKSRREL